MYRVYPTAKLLHFRVELQVKKKMDRTLHSGDNTLTHQCKRLFITFSLKPNILLSCRVAIFDILQAPPSINAPYPHPFALLQPRPRLPDLFPSRSLSPQHLPNLKAAYVGLVEGTDSLFAMSPEGFPLVVFGGSEARDKTTTKRDRDRDRKTLPAGEGKQEKKDPDEQIIDPHDSMCMQNPYDVRCIVGVRQVEGVDEPDWRLKELLDGPPAPRLKGPAPISTVPVPVVGVGRTPEDDNDDERWYNENTSGNTNTNRPGDVLTISDGRSNVLSHRSKLEVFLFTALFAVFSAWFLWKRVINGGEKARKRATVVEVVDHGPENPVVEETYLERDHLINDTSITLLDNGTTVHPTMSSSPPPPPPLVIMNGHADPINDITNTPIPIPPLTPNLKHQPSNHLPATSNPNPPLPISRIPLPSAAGVTDDNEDSDAEAEAENGAGTAATPGKRKARRGKRGKKKKPTILGGEEVGNGVVNGSDEKDKAEKEKVADKDLEGGGEKPSSLILTTSSPKPPAPPTPSLTVSDTILGMFCPLFLIFFLKKINSLISRLWFPWHSSLPRFIPRSSRSRQTSPPRFRNPSHSRSIHPPTIR
jgi:serine/threonine-protein kinase/endoribonuclease IRE1